MSSVTFLIPTFNEARNIEDCVTVVNNYASTSSLNYEILVIDSGSTDGTLDILQSMADTVKPLKIILQKTREGMGSALREAYPYATKDIICHYECDMPFSLSKIEPALELLERPQIDFVLGRRKGVRDSFLRVLYTAGYKLFLKLFFNASYSTINFSYKIFRRELLESISLKSSGWFIDAELVLETASAGFKVREIDVEYDKRVKGQSTVKVRDILKILAEAWAYWKKWDK